MANFTKLAATAKRLIEANGRQTTIRRVNRTPSDAQQPWRASEDPRVGADSVSVIACFVDPTSASKMGFLVEDDELVSRLSQVALVAATSTTADLATYDEVLDGSQSYRIDSVDVLKPASTKMLYVLKLAR